MEDSPKTAKRRAREATTISQMVALHCVDVHEKQTRTERAHCGELICSDCVNIDAYAVLRTERCRAMDRKTSCEECGNHCYQAAMRNDIRAIMRYAGPRMLARHPIAAIRHLLKR